jgi:hypothetical protein
MIYLSVLDNKVVDDKGITASANTKAEAGEIENVAKLLRELGVGVGECEDLQEWSMVDIVGSYPNAGSELLTLSLRPSTRAQPDRTKGSLAATTATTSTPLALISSYFFKKPGRCCWWHVGVNAPGMEKRTTFFPFHSSVENLVGIPQASYIEPKIINVSDVYHNLDTTYVVFELLSVGDVRKGGGGKLVADFDSHCDER